MKTLSNFIVPLLFVRTTRPCIHPIKSRVVWTSFHYPCLRDHWSKWGNVLFVLEALLKLAQLNVSAYLCLAFPVEFHIQWNGIDLSVNPLGSKNRNQNPQPAEHKRSVGVLLLFYTPTTQRLNWLFIIFSPSESTSELVQCSTACMQTICSWSQSMAGWTWKMFHRCA